MRTFVLAAALATWSSAALAQSAEGAACAITADCAGDLRCIDGSCAAVAGGKMVAPVTVRRERTAGDRAWVGDGKGYVAQVVAGDVLATLSAGALVAVALGTGQGWFAFAALFPTTLTAPIIHAAYGRGGPAAVSFFAWAAVPPTLTFFAALTAIGASDAGVSGVTGYAIGIGASVGLTALDAYFARSASGRGERVETSSVSSIVPTVAPLRGGFTAGLAGSF